MICTVIKLGGEQNRVGIGDGASVEDVVKIAQSMANSNYMSLIGEGSVTLQLGGEPCDLDDEVSDGDVITLTSKVKGGDEN